MAERNRNMETKRIRKTRICPDCNKPMTPVSKHCRKCSGRYYTTRKIQRDENLVHDLLEKKWTYQQLGKKYEITRERVGQIYKKNFKVRYIAVNRSKKLTQQNLNVLDYFIGQAKLIGREDSVQSITELKDILIKLELTKK